MGRKRLLPGERKEFVGLRLQQRLIERLKQIHPDMSVSQIVEKILTDYLKNR